MSLKKALFTFFAFVLSLSFSGSVFASEYSVRPFLIDVEGEPRSVFEKTVSLTNDSPHRKYVVYATVNEISVDNEGEIKEFVSPVMVDRTTTVTSWIEVGRGRIEIPPGEKKDIPVTIRVNPFAEPGVYHAYVGFVPAPNRPAAEKIAMDGEADGVVVKIVVADKREDSMKISGFLIDRFITGDDNRTVSVIVENKGDIASAPQGEIIFYDSRGVEIDAAAFNVEGVKVPPGETVTLTGKVPIDNTLGRFKANISLQYGENQRAALFDTTFFYVMPLHLLLIIFGVILIGAIAIILLFRKVLLNIDDDDEDGDEVMMYVRQGHDPNPKDHDIDLKNTNKDA